MHHRVLSLHINHAAPGRHIFVSHIPSFCPGSVFPVSLSSRLLLLSYLHTYILPLSLVYQHHVSLKSRTPSAITSNLSLYHIRVQDRCPRLICGTIREHCEGFVMVRGRRPGSRDIKGCAHPRPSLAGECNMGAYVHGLVCRSSSRVSWLWPTCPSLRIDCTSLVSTALAAADGGP